METVSNRFTALLEGPSSLTPRRVETGMVLSGRRVVVWDNRVNDWIRDVRACGNPFWRDEAGTHRWADGTDPPPGAVGVPELIVPVITERDFYTLPYGTRPEFIEWPAWMVWVEQ